MMALIHAARLSLNEVYYVTATADIGVYIAYCNVTDMTGETYNCEYTSRPDDPYGLNPAIRRWIAERPDLPITPHVPRSVEKLRTALPDISARQLRLGLLSAGIAPAQVTAAIEAMPPGPEREEAMIEWEYATTFGRCHPLISIVADALGLTDEEVDSSWCLARQR